MTTVQVTRDAVIDLIKHMPDDKLATLYDFGRFITQATPPVEQPRIDDVPKQDVSTARARLSATVAALQARSTGGRLSRRLMSERAEERARD